MGQVRTFFNTIRGRLIILVLLVIIPVLAVQIYGAWRNLRGDIEARKLESVRAITHASHDFEALLADARGVFADLVRVNELRSPANCTEVFTALRFAYERLAPNATNVGLADADGNIYCAVNPVQNERNLARRPEFQAAVGSLDMAVGSYGANPQTGAPQVTVTYPVLSFDGRVHTVIFAIITMGWLENWERESALPAGSAVTLLGTDERIRWRAIDGVPVALQTPNARTEAASWIAQMWSGAPPSEGADLDGVPRLNVVVPLRLMGQAAGFLHLGYPVAQLYAQAYRNLSWDLLLLGGVLLLALAFAWQGSERLFLHPLRNLMAAVQRVEAGDLSARVSAVRGLGEVGELAHTFDRMADTLQQREIARRQMEQRFRAAFESSAIGMGLLTLDGWILAANAAVCQMSGFTEDELKRRNDSENVYPPDAQVGMELFDEMLAGKRGDYSVEKRYVRKDGEIFWTRLTLSLVRDPRGEPAYLVALIEDIDEQKRKSAALAESEARFRAIFENSAVGMGLMSLDRVLLDANPAICAMYGYTRKELIGNTPALVTYPDDYPASTDQFGQLLSGETHSYISERRYVRKNGEVFWAQVSMSLVRDPDGKPLYLVGLVNDIDLQRRKETELAESEARFRAMYENAAIGISLIAPDGRVLAVNPVLEQLSGYSEAELRALGGQVLAYREDARVGRAELEEVLAGKSDTFQVEKRYVHKDGRVQWMRQSISAVRDAAGQARYLVAIAEDIDARKRAIESLRESEARFKAVFDNAAVGVAIMTLDRRIVHINPTVTRLTGYTPEEMLNINPSDMVVEEDRFTDRALFVELVAGQRDQYLVEKRYLRKDGSLFWGRVNFALVRDGAGQPSYIVGMIEDITEEKDAATRLAAQEAEYRRLLEQRIAERTEELSLANERLREKAAQDAVAAERSRLARDLHDAVTQTLFSTTLIADVLPDLWAMNPPEGQRRLEELRQLTRGALAEMRTLLVELRPNALTDIPLSTLLRQLTEAMISRSRIAIQLSTEGDLPDGRKLPGDVQVGLYRIAQEALNNVVKHAKATQAVVALRLGEAVRLTVADDGTGFDPSTVAADHLGLRIMRERAEAIGARFSVYSEPGAGTQVSVVWDGRRET
jgi:PAS domain S-box-containing protein